MILGQIYLIIKTLSMKNVKYFFGFIFLGLLVPYIYSIIAILNWGRPLYLHDPIELIGSFWFNLFTYYYLLAYLSFIAFLLYRIYLLIQRKVKFKCWETIYFLSLTLVFISRYVNYELWYLVFWFSD